MKNHNAQTAKTTTTSSVTQGLALDATPSIEAGLSSGDLDLGSLRLTQNFGETAGIKKLLTTVPCRKPSNQAFIRVHPDASWRMPAAILQLKDDGECYLVTPELFSELAQEVRPKMLYAAITRDGNPFIWPINMPGEDGRLDSWSTSAHLAAEIASERWIRLVANRTVGAYDVIEATNLADAPAWPDLSFEKLITLSFRDKVISSTDHVVVRRLRGEM